MATIEVDEETKRAVAFAAPVANLSESAIIRSLISATLCSRPSQSIRPDAVRSGRGSLRGRLVLSDDWDSPEFNESIADDFGTAQ